MELNEDIKIDPELCCKVCGEKNFNLTDGFYYCNECGTKHDQVRAVVVEEDDFDETGQKKKVTKKQKIHAPKVELPQLTSWECYNYILRGLVDELLTIGAKEELKLMALQVWAAYLRRTEVAFFNKRNVELPKLGVRFFKRDAKILYNHSKEKQKRKRKRDDISLKSAESSKREYRRSKRKLDESQYSINSTSITERSLYSNNTSTTATSTRAVILLRFTSLARKHYKKVMPINHLAAHEKDTERLLKCHKICPTKNKIQNFEFAATNLCIKQIYSVLAIALNLIEDEMQMTDLVRFINEEWMNKKNVDQYFPDNIAPHCKEILKDISFHLNRSMNCSYKSLRDQTSVLSKFLHIREFKKPDINKLAKRYATNLCLPEDIAVCIERLINLMPPKIHGRTASVYPAYEARAMAYIVFVLKLLFGLDGYKETMISDAARLINVKIGKINDAFELQQKKLFVWNDWMEYIEMRKVIIVQFNQNFGRRYDQYQDPLKLLEELSEENIRQNETEVTKIKAPANKKIAALKRIFDQLNKDYNNKKGEKDETLLFSPSYTPEQSNFKRILLHASSSDKCQVNIPEFMRLDHSQRTIRAFLQPKTLDAFFKKIGANIKIQKIPCTEHREFVGVFRPPPDGIIGETSFEADFNINEEDWLKQIKKEPQMEELEFKKTYDNYHIKHLQRLRRKLGKQDNTIEFKEPKEMTSSNLTNAKNKMSATINHENYDLLSLNSIDVFHEGDMEPIENLNLSSPRRRFDGVELFKDVSSDDDNESEPEFNNGTADANHSLMAGTSTNELTFLISNLDYWVLNGHINQLSEVQKKVLEHHFPRSFFWLLQTCAQTLSIDWSVLYEQLLVIEVMFVYGIESLEEFRDCIKLKSNLEIKDLNQIVQLLRELF